GRGDGCVGEVSGEGGFDGGDIGGVIGDDGEVARGWVVLRGEVEGHDGGGGGGNGDGLLVRDGVDGIGPVDLDAAFGERVVGIRVARLFIVLVEDDADGDAFGCSCG